MFDNPDKWHVERLRSGSEEAYVYLFQKYAGKVYHVSRKMNLCHEDAEGVAQIAFLKIWKNRAQLKSELSFNSYLLTIVKSIVIKLVKKRALEIGFLRYSLSDINTQSVSTEDDILYEDMLAVSNDYLNDLPDKQKKVFIMKNVDHMTSDQIANELNLSKRTVENQIYRATKTLKTKLGELDIISWLIFLLWF